MTMRRRATLLITTAATVLLAAPLGTLPAGAAVPPSGAIKHVVVIDLENESFSTAFGPNSPAPYLATTLPSLGVLITHYYGIGHVSLPNYLAQVSGQAPTPTTQADCLTSFANVSPGTATTGTGANGQVKATSGCVYPASVGTIASQLDALSPPNATTHVASWRVYEQDMGNDPTRDGGTSCAHPATNGSTAWLATATDGYVDRHNPLIWFRSTISKTAECKANIVPLGGTKANGKPRSSGPLVTDFASEATTPAYAFITPSVCNDGHDAPCTSKSAAGGRTGGLKAANAWLKQWMPVLLGSPAYTSGDTVIVVTFDEAEVGGTNATAACCSEAPGPNVTNAGVTGPGGGQVGAVVLASSRYLTPGTVDTTDSYNHYGLLRTTEDLLGITSGGSDGLGHLGMAGAAGVSSFGADVFDAPSP